MMYDELIKRLRECTAEQNGEKTLWHEAADAIEELQQTVEHYNGCSDDWFKEACEYKSMLPRWIPVTERLPEEMETVIVTDGKNVGYSFCVNDYGTLDFYSPWNITHWMPFPLPPKENKL